MRAAVKMNKQIVRIARFLQHNQAADVFHSIPMRKNLVLQLKAVSK